MTYMTKQQFADAMPSGVKLISLEMKNVVLPDEVIRGFIMQLMFPDHSTHNYLFQTDPLQWDDDFRKLMFDHIKSSPLLKHACAGQPLLPAPAKD